MLEMMYIYENLLLVFSALDGEGSGEVYYDEFVAQSLHPCPPP